LKDYKRQVFWLDYFNSSLSREKGRRIPIDRAVKDPTISELIESARRLGLESESTIAKHPDRMNIPSGYISVPKRGNQKKQYVISEIAKALSEVRGERSSVEVVEKGQKKVPHRKPTR